MAERFKKNNVKKPTADSIVTVQKRNAVESAVVYIISLLVFLAFGYIAVFSIFQTSIINPNDYGNENILYQDDNFLLNFIFIALFTVFVFKVNKHCDFFARVNMKFMEIGLFAYAVILGFIWIFSVQCIPGADSYNIFETATQTAQGDYTSLHNGTVFNNSDYYQGFSYYTIYPFQLGFVFFCEIVYRIFGTASAMPIQVINVLCIAAAYIAVAKITKLIFSKRSVEFISIMMLAGCIQPILFTTFAYGNIIGMCCALWASWFLIKYFKGEKYILLLPCGLLLTLSVMVKYNNMIYLIAFVIMLIVHTFRNRKWQSIAFALAICVACAGVNSLVIMSYEKRADVELSSGVSQPMYLDMGLNESGMAPGWYNAIALSLYINNDGNVELAEQQAWEDINKRLDIFNNSPNYALNFFGNKILSQWNEPTFESIWVSRIRGHATAINGLVESAYTGSLGQFFDLYFNFYMQIIYILFAAGIYLLFINKKLSIETVLLPLVLLGGFGYHLLFEGKSQYILTYIILLIPTAAYSLNVIVNGKYTKIKEIIAKLKLIPENETVKQK